MQGPVASELTETCKNLLKPRGHEYLKLKKTNRNHTKPEWNQIAPKTKPNSLCVSMWMHCGNDCLAVMHFCIFCFVPV